MVEKREVHRGERTWKRCGHDLEAAGKMSYSIRPLTTPDEPILWDMLYEAAHLTDEQAPSAVMRENPELARYARGPR